MKSKQNKKLDSGMTYLLVLMACLYAFFVCYCCFMILNDERDFGVAANYESEMVWKVSE